MSTDIINVVIADDHLAMRAGLQLLLSEDPNIHCVGEAISGDEIIPLIEQTHPHVLLLDLSMPHLQDVSAFVRRLRHDFPCLEVLVITSYDDIGLISALLKAGATGYMLKSDMDDMDTSLVQAVRQVAGGHPYLTRKAIEGSVYSMRQTDHPSHEIRESLSERELEVLHLAGEGYTNEEIGQALCISPLTARNHLSRVYEKLHVRGRAEAVRYATEHRLISSGSALRTGGGGDLL